MVGRINLGTLHEVALHSVCVELKSEHVHFNPEQLSGLDPATVIKI